MYTYEDLTVDCTTCYANVGRVTKVSPTGMTENSWCQPYWRPAQTPNYRYHPASRLIIELAHTPSFVEAEEAIFACHAVECPAKEN